MDNCTICFESLCVPVFQEANMEVSIENDCSRLPCGHAFHTKCLIQSLHMTRGCPLCRVIDEREDPRDYSRQRLYMRTCCDEILSQIKNEVLSEHVKEYASFSNELEKKRKLFNKKVHEFKEALRNEMKIESIIDHMKQVKQDTKRLFHREIKKRGGIFKTAIKTYNNWYSEEKLLFGEKSPWYFNTKNKIDFW